MHQPASFAVSLNGAKGALDAKVHSPSGAVEECHISEVTEGQRRAAPYILTHRSALRPIDVC